MSNVLTRAARPLRLAPNDKAVLMALADMARDPEASESPAQCWPPMHGRDGAIGLCDWTCLSERAVQRSVKSLKAAGLIDRRQLSHGARYTILLAASPVPQSGDCQSGDPQSGDCQTPSPVPQSPKALGSTNRRKKASPSPLSRAVAIDPYPMPTGIDPGHWRDFLANRKRKRLSNTASAHETLIADLTRHATAEWPWSRLIALAAGKGWASVRNPDREDGRYGRPVERPAATGGGLRGSRPDPALDLRRLALAEIEAEERAAADEAADRGPWPALPSHGGG